MDARQFNSFIRESIAIQQGQFDDRPSDYLMTKVAATMAFPALRKHASMGAHAIELAGLGILARPSVQELRGKQMSEHSKHMHEIGGLGVLAAPSAYELGKAGLGKLRALRGR
jgi:hypothetical protein